MAESAKRCLYEILNVARDASQEEIRSSYRRLALQLHPDKNPNSSTAAFQELQSAYEVLSDPKERQFYDSHRSQILFSNPNPKSSKSVFDLDLVIYFSLSAFSGYGDTGKGFFKVYGDVFGKIYAQELFFVKELGLDQDLVRPAPLIGNLESEYSQVTAFYSYWLGFVTVLDFGWVDEYDAALGVNRKSRRLMDEENKKKRKKAKREYVDLVRDLASFVKKRDRRVSDMQLKKSLEEEKRREEEIRRKKEEDRRKIEKARLHEEQEWTKIYEDGVGFFDDDDGDADDMGKKKEEFYCVVCNKKFKSDKQWKNHEQSKKHRQKVAELRVSFQVEEEEEEVDFQSLDDGGIEKMGDDNVVDEFSEDFKEDFILKEEEGVEDADLEKDEVTSSEDDEAGILEAMLSGQKSRKNSFTSLADSLTDHGSCRNANEESSVEHDSRKGRKNRAARRGTDANVEYEILRGATNVNRESEFEVHNQEENVGRPKEGQIQNEGEDVKETKEDTSASSDGVAAKVKGNQGAGKKSKKQQVDVRGPAKKDTNISKSKGKKQKGSACDTCGESFDTRNKLFAHLGATGHASLKSR